MTPAARPIWCCLAALLWVGGHATAARGQASSSARAALGGIGFDERLDQEPLLLAALPRSTADLPPLVVRVDVDLPATRADRLASLTADLDRRVSAYTSRGIRVVLGLGGFPASDADVEAWRQALRSVADLGRGKVAGYQIGEVSGAVPPATDRYVFLLKLASVQLRSVDATALIFQGRVPVDFEMWQTGLYAAGIAPYVDGLALHGPSAADDDAFRASVARLTALVEREDRTAPVVLGPIALSRAGETAQARFFDAEVQSLGTPVRLTSFTGTASDVRAALTVAARAADLLSGALVTIEERAAGLRLSRGSTDLGGAIPHRLLFSTTRFSTYLVYGGSSETMPITVQASVADAAAPQVRDPVLGSVERSLRAQRPEGTRIIVTVPLARHPLVLDFNAGATDRVVESAEVQQETLPAVAEIIARYQQAQAAQDTALTRYIAHLRIEQHFHLAAADPSYNVVTENRMFFERGAVEWEELSFSFNGAKWTSNRPSFPILQPEKVLSLPLDLRLGQDYTYRLVGVDTVAGRAAYVIRFEPLSSDRALYRGTVWIDHEQFVRLKVQAVESHLAGLVVSNDETHTFTRVGDVQGRPIWLLDRLSSKQMLLVAGRTVLVEREARLTDLALNPEAFDAERTAARASDRIMYRDTEQGLRYLVKRGEVRVVSAETTKSTRAFAFGAQIDPSFDYPLPLGGLDVLDFNFLQKDVQFALLFAGVLAAGNLQKPHLWGPRVDASVDFFGLAVGANDAVFGADGERTAERVRRVPGAAGLNLGFQATPFQKVSGHYEFRFDGFSRDPKAASDFTPPASAGTHGLGVGYEFRRAGYSLAANIMKHRRTTAAPWGPARGLEDAAKAFTMYDLGLSKDFIFATFHTIHLNGAYFGGTDLDRFSMYQFGLFDANRMHGVPSAVRFGELAMFRGSYSFNLFDQYRVDLFLDHARGRDKGSSNGWVPVTGAGLGLNLRAPKNTILRTDLGKSFLPEGYRGAGSFVLQILLLKPL